MSIIDKLLGPKTVRSRILDEQDGLVSIKQFPTDLYGCEMQLHEKVTQRPRGLFKNKVEYIATVWIESADGIPIDNFNSGVDVVSFRHSVHRLENWQFEAETAFEQHIRRVRELSGFDPEAYYNKEK